MRENFSCPEAFIESDIIINETTIPACVNDKINYTLIGLKDEEGNVKAYIYNETAKTYSGYSFAHSTDLKIIILDLKELENATKTKVTIDGMEYDAYTYNESDRFFIIYGKNIENGEEDFYLYDSKNNTFSSYDRDFITNLFNKKQDEDNIYKYVALVFGIGLFLSIICIFLLNKKNGKNNKKSDITKNATIDKKEENEIIEENIIEEKQKKKRKK